MGTGDLLLLSRRPSPSPPSARYGPVPSRLQVCAGQHTFQGMSVPLPTGSTFDPLKAQYWFDPLITQMPSQADRLAVYAEHRRLGDTLLLLSLDLGGLDTLPAVIAIGREAVTLGGMTGLILMCMGDGHTVDNLSARAAGRVAPVASRGQSSRIMREIQLAQYPRQVAARSATRAAGHGHNSDPGALGHDWLMANFPAIYAQVRASNDGDLTNTLAHRTVFVPGFDGVVPDWQPPTLVDEFVMMARGVCDFFRAGRVGLQLSSGYPTWGGPASSEQNNWITPAGRAIDVVLLESPIDLGPPLPVPHVPVPDIPAEWTQVYQVGRRLVSPNWPVNGQFDDLHPPFLLQSIPEAERPVVHFWEFATYRWTEPWRTGGAPYALALVEARRAALTAMGCTHTG